MQRKKQDFQLKTSGEVLKDKRQLILFLEDDIITGKNNISKYEWAKCVVYVGNILVEVGDDKINKGTSLVAQWLRLCSPNAGGLGSFPGQGTRSHMHAATKSFHAATKEPACRN